VAAELGFPRAATRGREGSVAFWIYCRNVIAMEYDIDPNCLPKHFILWNRGNTSSSNLANLSVVGGPRNFQMHRQTRLNG
jgi:hypothetical protein